MTDTMGRWVVTPRAWYDVSVLNCSLCGKMLPGKLWSVQIAGQEHIFCDAACEAIYREYWYPRYGADAPSSWEQQTQEHPASQMSPPERGGA